MSFSVASGRTSQGEKKVAWRCNDTCHQFCFLWTLLYPSTERASDSVCHRNVVYSSCEGGLCWGGSDISSAAEAAKVQNWYMTYWKQCKMQMWCLYRDWKPQGFVQGLSFYQGCTIMQSLSLPLSPSLYIPLCCSSFGRGADVSHLLLWKRCLSSWVTREKSVQSILPCASYPRKSWDCSGNLSTERSNLQIPTGMFMT